MLNAKITYYSLIEENSQYRQFRLLSRVPSMFQEYLSSDIFEYRPKRILVAAIYHLDLCKGWTPQDNLFPFRPEVRFCSTNSLGQEYFLVSLFVFFGTESDSRRINPYKVREKILLVFVVRFDKLQSWCAGNSRERDGNRPFARSAHMV